MIKRTLTTSDYFLIIVNLVPLYGVWFRGWDAAQMFLVYCMESVIIGLFQFLKLWLITLVQKRALWNMEDPKSEVSGYYFMFFFLLHFGFFIFIQMKIFLEISSIHQAIGTDPGVFDFLFHFPKYMQTSTLWLLLLFAASYALIMLKDFILTGAYKTANMNVVMFQPYMRIFVQQVTVILGSLFLGLGAANVFMLVFVCPKIFFEIILPYNKIFNKTLKPGTVKDE